MKKYFPIILVAYFIFTCGLIKGNCQCDTHFIRITTQEDSIKNMYVIYRNNIDSNQSMLKTYWNNGKVQAISYFKNNKREGKWSIYFDDGTLTDELNFHDNRKIGIQISMYPNGKLSLIENYDSSGNKIFGYYYDQNGKPKEAPKNYDSTLSKMMIK